MVIRIARTVCLVLAFSLIFGVRPASADGLSLPKLFPDNKSETKKTPIKQTKSQPSTISKMSNGTKKFFTNVGDTLTFKKSAPRKQSSMPTNPWFKQPKEEPSKSSWLTSIFYKEEPPKKAKTPSEWLGQPRLDP